MNLSALLKPAAEESAGKWFAYEEGVRFLLAPDGNPKHAAIRARLAKPIVAKGKAATLDDNRLAIARSLAEGVVLGWEGIESDGQPVPFSAEICAQILAGDTLESRNLRDWVMATSAQATNFRQEAEVAAGGELKSEA